MKCPGCASEMTVQELSGVEIDQCPECGGIVLDKGENEALEALNVARVIEGSTNASQKTATREGSAHCHECKSDMIPLTGAGDIEYDWCPNCERLFFDHGELTALQEFQAD